MQRADQRVTSVETITKGGNTKMALPCIADGVLIVEGNRFWTKLWKDTTVGRALKPGHNNTQPRPRETRIKQGWSLIWYDSHKDTITRIVV